VRPRGAAGFARNGATAHDDGLFHVSLS
jgi:hypothetical protein